MEKGSSSELLSLPNEVLQRIYVLSGNCHLLNVNRSLRDRLDLLMLRPQLVEYFFADYADHGTPKERRRSACDLRALLNQPWVESFIDDLPIETIRRWVRGDNTIISRLVQGSWTQARGDLLMRALQYSRQPGTNIQYPVFQKSLMAALQECCVPAVIVLSGFSQQEWIRWDQKPIDVEWKRGESYEAMQRRLRQATLVAAGRSGQRIFPECTTKHDFGDEHARLALQSRTDKPWTKFKHAGVRFSWQRPNMTTAHVLFCMQNVCRNPVLYEFVIRNTVDQWIMYHGITPSELKTFILCKAHLTEITAWALDPANHSEGLGPATGVKLQLFYGRMLKRGVFGLAKSDLPCLCQEDAHEAARGEWVSFGISV